MKTYNELTPKQQENARINALEKMLKAILEGAIRFDDDLNQDNLQAKIDAAFEKSEAARTPWFAHEYIMDTCREELEGMAQCEAEDSLYAEENEFVVYGIA